MTETDTEKLEHYYSEGGSWSQDRLALWQRSLRLAWLTASTASIVAVAEAVAIVSMQPLKTIVPYTLLVDRQTGYVQALDPIHGELLTPTAALTRSFLVQYVIARESFVIETLQQNYKKTVLWSEGDVRSNYVTQMQNSNPQSPLAMYQRRTVLDVQITSVTLTGNNTGVVRFTTTRSDPGSEPRAIGSWIATITYRYSGDPMTAQDRLINPLGFRVTRYHKDVELMPEVSQPPISGERSTGLITEGKRAPLGEQPTQPQFQVDTQTGGVR